MGGKADRRTRLVEARSAAHRLAMAPFAFQCARAARELGLLSAVGAEGRAGAEVGVLVTRTGLPETSVSVLLDACLATDLLVEDPPGRWRLTTLGEVWLRDAYVALDAEFAHTVCWRGLADLTASLRDGAPVGLRHFGPWATVYEGLTALPPRVRDAWFAYDHGHSDVAFDRALAIVLETSPRSILDVGGNTGRFATRLLEADDAITVTLVDHPAVAAEAEKRLATRGLAARCTCVGLDLCDHRAKLPGTHDAIWMSQFLDCFAPADVIALFDRARAALAPGGAVWVLELCPDRQEERGAATSLRLASLYFTAIANGVSRFYRARDLLALAEAAGLRCDATHDGLGSAHTLFRFVPRRDP